VGRLHRVHQGVYVVGHQRLTWHGRCMAAVLAASPSVASHLSAGWLWGLLQSRPGTLHVTCRQSRHAKRPFVTHTADLARADLARRDGIPVTSLARTILDLAVDSRERTVRRFIRQADDDKNFDLRAMEDLLARTKGHEIDAYWADHRFGVELDVFGTHGSRLSFEEDRERDDELLLAGIETTRVTGPRLAREPEAVVDSVRRHLARRSGA
jgi:very-short-patch-repair endonuclease